MIHLKILDLVKKFGTTYQLGPIDFETSGDHTIAIIGKNGAGKSTLFQLLTGNLDATQGIVTLNENELRPEAFQVKKKVGYLPQEPELPPWTTAEEILLYAAKVLEIPSPESAADQKMRYWDCHDFRHRPFTKCSYGMQKRIGLALATVNEPDLLILDEPFSGLDIYHVKALEDELVRRQKDGKLTLVSTHVASYAAQFCNKACLIDAGKFSELTKWKSADLLERMKIMESCFFSDRVKH